MIAEKSMRWVSLFVSAAVAAMVMVLPSGCEIDNRDSKDNDKGSNTNTNANNNSSGGVTPSVVGSWMMYTAGDGYTFYWKFNADGTVASYTDSAFANQDVNGTYSQDGVKVTGSFVNPGVGDGEIDATLSDDGNTMQMDFIEFWHDPAKVVPYVGTRL